jgi:hypothetical protein
MGCVCLDKTQLMRYAASAGSSGGDPRQPLKSKRNEMATLTGWYFTPIRR